jgi:hypothetical protein
VRGRDAGDPDGVVVSEAFAAARELLQQAEADAARIRADADRYLRQREQEAELIVAKARRVLTMAEDRAVVISTAGPVAPPEPARIVLDVDAPAPALDLDPTADGAPAGAGRSGLDSIVASSVSRAIHRALATDG